MGLGFSNHIELTSADASASLELDSSAELRRHFAREVHDQLAQPLIALVLEIHELRTLGEVPAAVAEELARLEDTTRKILRQAREMMVDLRNRGELRINLGLALKNELPVPEGRDLILQLTSRWPKHTNGWAAFNVLRIVQQAVANAWRHGKAHKVEVVLDVGPTNEAVVVVLDDGVGIDDAPRGFGMDGMQERAAILGGTLNAMQRDSGGTRVEVRFPVGRLA